MSASTSSTSSGWKKPGSVIARDPTFYKIYYHYAYLLGESEVEPTLIADSIMDKNGHILPFVRFEGGRLRLSPESVLLLDRLATFRGG